ncbi:MAG: LPXTG cell wall anchor domain-containing protein [Ruminococcaceae bacterium]|nr:LPXTG cell wall anchor domain-containing protein [Oscillospiraceae bacterium]
MSELFSAPTGDIGSEYYIVAMVLALAAMVTLFIIGKKRK